MPTVPEPLSVEPRTIYLQLHNYAFFHGPSQMDDVDDRFIGRDHILTKLRTLLTNAESKSGAYLVTGYRGMGKSSFVGRVLHDITSFQTSGRKTSRYFRILVPLIFFSLLDVLRAPILLFVVPFFVFSTTTIYLLQSSHHIRELGGTPRDEPGGFGTLWRRLKLLRGSWKPIFFELWRIDSPVSSKRPRMFAQDFFLLSVIQMIATAYFFCREWMGQPAPGSSRLTVYLILFAALVAFNLVGQALYPQSGSRLRWWRRLKKLAADFAAHSDQVHIRINLGYDDLSELDILRLMARNVLSSYRAKMRALSFPQISWTTAKALILYVLVGLFFYVGALYPLHQDLSRSTRRAVGEVLADSRFAPVISPAQNIARSIDGVVQRTYDLTKNAAPALPWPLADIRDAVFLTPLNAVLVPKLWGDQSAGDRDGREQFRLLPKDVNYLFWLYFALAWVATGWLSRRGFGGLVTHSLILKRLQDLNDLIDSQVTHESGGPSNAPGWLSLLRRSRRSYQRLSDREIEMQLIEILDDVARIPRISMRPEFILIFDEVDKIEPHQNATYAAQDEAGVLPGAPGSADVLRSRQRNVQRLLSNLKYLLTTAKAKFIFIAGRELFDASLADVSDRNFFMGSIFNEVINVESFMKDRAIDAGPDAPRPGHGDVTRMAEYFVFSALLPPDRRVTGCTAQCYRSFVWDVYGLAESRPMGLSSDDVETVMGVLHNFVTYLTYRSNGAPKKLASLFERFVTQSTTTTLMSDRVLCVGHTARQLYLCFDGTDRYSFSVGSYVITPFFTSLDKQIKEFGDKLLVSSAFLVDHLYKFHRAAFSWRSIELTPEILDINRAPHLRELITTIVRFLQRGHLKEIDNGLFNFKFRRKISEEITVLSRLNEREAAAFNFTLDESLATKQHYTKQLRDLEHRYKPHFGASPGPEWVRSISFLHMIVGDLHYYDEEYDNAIVEYMEAVQLFGRDRVKTLPFESFIVLVRNTLKLGLSFERRRTYDSALMTYGKLVARIIRFRAVRRGEVEDPNVNIHDHDAVMEYADREPLTRNRAYLAFRQDVMQSLRLLYQPALAKFQIKEKLFKDGVTPRDLRTVDREWKAIVGVAPCLIHVDFLDRVGDVLFYKNRSWIPPGGPALMPSAPPVRPVYCHDTQARCGQNDELDRVLAQGRDTPCVACRRYNQALDLLTDGPLLPGALKDGDRVGRLTALAALLDREAENVGARKTAPVLRALAANLSNIADSFLSCAGPAHRISADFLTLLSQWLHAGDDRTQRTPAAEYISRYLKRTPQAKTVAATRAIANTSMFNKTEEVLSYVFLSAAFFRRAGDHRSAGWQYTKLLYILRDVLRAQPTSARQPLKTAVRAVIKGAASAARRNYDAASDNAYWLRDMRRRDDGTINPVAKLGESSGLGNWDSREVDVVVEEFDSILEDLDQAQAPTRRPRVTSMYNRILDLRLLAIQAGRFAARQAKHAETAPTEDLLVIQNTIAVNLAKVIGAWSAVIRITGYFGESFNISHSLIASAHYRLADALKSWKANVPSGTKHPLYQDLVMPAIDHIKSIEAAINYHSSLAIRHYRQALDVHDGGVAYRQIIDDMVFLNDDFNDDLYHFCAAQERYWLNRLSKDGTKPVVYERLDELKARLAKRHGAAPGE